MQFLDIEKPREGKLMIFESGSVMWLQSRCLPGFPSSKDLTGLEVPKWLFLSLHCVVLEVAQTLKNMYSVRGTAPQT